MKKRFFCILLALVVCLLALCITAGAASDTQLESSIIRIDGQLGDGSPYVKYVDSFMDMNNNYAVLENVTVHACNHMNETGRYTFVCDKNEDYV